MNGVTSGSLRLWLRDTSCRLLLLIARLLPLLLLLLLLTRAMQQATSAATRPIVYTTKLTNSILYTI